MCFPWAGRLKNVSGPHGCCYAVHYPAIQRTYLYPSAAAPLYGGERSPRASTSRVGLLLSGCCCCPSPCILLDVQTVATADLPGLAASTPTTHNVATRILNILACDVCLRRAVLPAPKSAPQPHKIRPKHPVPRARSVKTEKVRAHDAPRLKTLSRKFPPTPGGTR